MGAARDRSFARPGEGDWGRREGRVQAHLNPWFSAHLSPKRRREMWSKDTAVYTVVPFSAGTLSLALSPAFHYARSEASPRGMAKGVSVVYLRERKTGRLFMLTSRGRLNRGSEEGKGWLGPVSLSSCYSCVAHT